MNIYIVRNYHFPPLCAGLTLMCIFVRQRHRSTATKAPINQRHATGKTRICWNPQSPEGLGALVWTSTSCLQKSSIPPTSTPTNYSAALLNDTSERVSPFGTHLTILSQQIDNVETLSLCQHRRPRMLSLSKAQPQSSLNFSTLR